jgi:hypothetical protein
MLPLSETELLPYRAFDMLSRVYKRSLPVLVELCRSYDSASLWSVANVLSHEYADSVYKDWRSISDIIEFTVIAAPLLASEDVIRVISADGVSVRKVVPSMLSARYSDDVFEDWSDPKSVQKHVSMVRGTFLHSTIFTPQFDSGADKLWLGENYRTVLPLIAQLRERQSVDIDLIRGLSNNASPSLVDGVL